MKRTPLKRKTPLKAFKEKRWGLRRAKHFGLHKRYDARWMGIRKLACELAREHCEGCGAYAPLHEGHGHHIQQRSTNPELKYELSNISWLCADCHRAVHEGPKPVPPKPALEER